MHRTEPTSSPDTKLYVLGGFRAVRSEVAVAASEWKRRPARTIVKMLAAQPGHTLHRDVITDALWGDRSTHAALNEFHKAVHAARQVLDCGPERRSTVIVLRQEMLSLVADSIWIDLDAFEEAGTLAVTSGDLNALRAARTLYTGDLLPEDRYGEWVIARQRSLDQLLGRTLSALAEAEFQEGSIVAAETAWQDLLQRDPGREDAYRGMMRAAMARGVRGDALSWYAEMRAVLSRDFGVDPEPESRELYRAVVAGDYSPPSISRRDASTQPQSPANQETALPSPLRLYEGQRAVGREGALEALCGDLTDAGAGHGCVALVAGEPGIGKTRLLVDLAREAARRGCVVLWGAGYGGTMSAPFAPFAEAIEEFLAAMPAERIDDLARRYGQLSALLPSLARRETAVARAENESSRGAARPQFMGLLDEIVGDRNVFLVIDDIHEADEASVLLFHQIARAAASKRWFIAATYRSIEVELHAPVSSMLAALRREHLRRQITLPRLDERQTAALVRGWLAGEVSADIPRAVYARSLGNPLFARELVRSMQASEEVYQEGNEWRLAESVGTPVPTSVVDLVLSRLSGQPLETRAVLNVASLIGLEVPLKVLRPAAERAFPGLTAQQLSEALDYGLASAILEDRGEIYGFRHPLIHAAIRDAIPSHRRTGLHGAIAAAMETFQRNDVQGIAAQYLAAGQSAKALPYLTQAAERATDLHAHGEAADLYRAILHHLDDSVAPRELIRARMGLGNALMRSGRYADALSVFDVAMRDALACGAMEQGGYAEGLIGHVHYLRGDAAEGLQRVDDFLTRFGERMPAVTLALLLAVRASLLNQLGRYDEELEAAERACELLATQPADPRLEAVRVTADTWRGVALHALDRQEEAVETMLDVVPRAEHEGDLFAASRAANALAAIFEQRGEIENQLEYLEQALDSARRLGDPARLVFSLYRRARARHVIGDWVGAHEDLGAAIDVDAQLGPSWGRPYISLMQGHLALSEGRMAEARERFEYCSRLIGDATNPHIQWALAILQAHVDLQTGRYREAAERLVPMSGERAPMRGDRAYTMAMLARAHVGRHDLGEARRVLECATQLIASTTDEPARMGVLLAASEVALAAGEGDEARVMARKLAELARRLRHPWMEGVGLWAEARAWIDEDDVVSALPLLQDAAATFSRLGAKFDLARVEGQRAALVPKRGVVS